MSEILQVYKCKICGNIVEVLHKGIGQLVCCGQPMNLLEEKSEDQGKEKHVPVTEKTARGIKVKVGSIPHPMEEKHYIEWIEIKTSNGICKKFLKTGDLPEVEFDIEEDILQVRAYCNIHGLWSKNQ
jgi:superoxide reductase